MGHSGKEVSQFFSQFPCVAEQNVKLFHSVHPNKFHTPHHQHEVPLPNQQHINMSVPREANLLHVFPDNNHLCFPIYP